MLVIFIRNELTSYNFLGLFSGILILVLTIISLIMFFELAEVNIELAVLQVRHICLYDCF